MSYQKNFIVEVQHCQNCYLHSWCSRHDENKYDDHFQKVKANAEQIFPNVQVLRNKPPNTYDQIGELGSKGQTKYFDLKSQQIIHFPRFGAFQIYVNGNLIFSKIQSNLWPKHDRIAKIFADILNQSQQSGNIQKFSLQYRLKNDHDEYFVDTYKKLIKRQFSASRRPLSQNHSQNTFYQYLDSSPSQIKKGNFISRKVNQSASKKTEQISRQSRSRKIEYRKQALYSQYGSKRPQTHVDSRKQKFAYLGKNAQQNVKRQVQLQDIKVFSQNSNKFKGSPIRTKLKIIKEGSQFKPIGKSPQSGDHLKKGGRRIFRNNLREQAQQKPNQKKPLPTKVNNFLSNYNPRIEDQKQNKKEKEFQRLNQKKMSDQEFIQEINRIDQNQQEKHFSRKPQQESEQTVEILPRKMKSSKDQYQNQNAYIQKSEIFQSDTNKNVTNNHSNREDYQEQTYEDLIREQNNQQELIQVEDEKAFDRNKSPSIDHMVHYNKRTQQQELQRQNETKNFEFQSNKLEKLSSKVNGWNSSSQKNYQMPTQNQLQLQMYAKQRHFQNSNLSKRHLNNQGQLNNQAGVKEQESHQKQQNINELMPEEYNELEILPKDQKVQSKIFFEKPEEKLQQKSKKISQQKVQIQNKKISKREVQDIQKLQVQQKYEFQQNIKQSKGKNIQKREFIKQASSEVFAKAQIDINYIEQQKKKDIKEKFKNQVQIQYEQEFLQEQVPKMQKYQNQNHQQYQNQIRPQSRDSRHSSRRLLNGKVSKNNLQVQQARSSRQKDESIKNQSVLDISNHSAFKKQKTSQMQKENQRHIANVEIQKQLEQDIQKSKEEDYEDLLYEDQNQQSQSIPIIVSKQDGTSKIIQQGIQKDFSPSQMKVSQSQKVALHKEQKLNQNIAELQNENEPQIINGQKQEQSNKKTEKLGSQKNEHIKSEQSGKQQVQEFLYQKQGQIKEDHAIQNSLKDKIQQQSSKVQKQNQQKQQGTAKLIQNNIDLNPYRIYDQQVNKINQIQEEQHKNKGPQNPNDQKTLNQEQVFQPQNIKASQLKQKSQSQLHIDKQEKSFYKQQDPIMYEPIKSKQNGTIQKKTKNQQESLKKQEFQKQQTQQIFEKKQLSVNQQYEQISKAQLQQLIFQQPKQQLKEKPRQQSGVTEQVLVQINRNQKYQKQDSSKDQIIQSKFQQQKSHSKTLNNKQIVHDYVTEIQDLLIKKEQLKQKEKKNLQNQQPVQQKNTLQEHNQDQNELNSQNQQKKEENQRIKQTQKFKQNEKNDHTQHQQKLYEGELSRDLTINDKLAQNLNVKITQNQFNKNQDQIKAQSQSQIQKIKKSDENKQQNQNHLNKGDTNFSTNKQIVSQYINDISQKIQVDAKEQTINQKNQIQQNKIAQDSSKQKDDCNINLQNHQSQDMQEEKAQKQMQENLKKQETIQKQKQENYNERAQDKTQQKLQEKAIINYLQKPQENVQQQIQTRAKEITKKIAQDCLQFKAKDKIQQLMQQQEIFQVKAYDKVQQNLQTKNQEKIQGKMQKNSISEQLQKDQEKLQQNTHKEVQQLVNSVSNQKRQEKFLQNLKQKQDYLNQGAEKKANQNLLQQKEQKNKVQELKNNAHQKIQQNFQKKVQLTVQKDFLQKEKLLQKQKQQVLKNHEGQSHGEEINRKESNINTNRQIVNEYVNEVYEDIQNLNQEQRKLEDTSNQKNDKQQEKSENVQVAQKQKQVKQQSSKAQKNEHSYAKQQTQNHQDEQPKQSKAQEGRHQQNMNIKKQQRDQKLVLTDRNNQLYQQRFDDIKLGINSKKQVQLPQQPKDIPVEEGPIQKSNYNVLSLKEQQQQKQKILPKESQCIETNPKLENNPVAQSLGNQAKKQSQDQNKDNKQVQSFIINEKTQSKQQIQEYDRTDSKLTTNKEIVQNYVHEINQKATKINSQIQAGEMHEEIHKQQQKITPESQIIQKQSKQKKVQGDKAITQKDQHTQQYSRFDSKLSTNKQIVSEYIYQMSEKVQQDEKIQVTANKEEKDPVPKFKLMANMQKNIQSSQEEVVVNQ